MATPHEEFFRLVREIRDILVEKDRTVMASVGSSRTVVNLGPVTASLNNLLSELETQTTTLSTLALDASVDGLEGFVDGVEALITSGNSLLSDIDTKTAAGNVDLAAMEILLTSIETLLTATNVDLAAIETLITAGNIDLAAIEVLLTTANSDRAANQVANQTDLDSLVSLITTANSNRTDDQAANQTDFNAMVTDLAALEALSTTLNSIQTDIKTLLTAGNVDLAALEVLAISIETALYSPNASGDEWLGDIQGSLGINGSIFGKLEDVEDALKQPITGLDWGGLLLIELGLILAQNVLLVADTTAQIVLMTAGNASLAAIAVDTSAILADTTELADQPKRFWRFHSKYTSTGINNLRLQWLFPTGFAAKGSHAIFLFRTTHTDGQPFNWFLDLRDNFNGENIHRLTTQSYHTTDPSTVFQSNDRIFMEDDALRFDSGGIVLTGKVVEIFMRMEVAGDELPVETYYRTSSFTITETESRIT